MQKVVENAVFKITQAMEKNRKAYAEASEWYIDTGYDRYWNKMERLEKEYEEFKTFLGLNTEENKNALEHQNAGLYAENVSIAYIAVETVTQAVFCPTSLAVTSQ